MLWRHYILFLNDSGQQHQGIWGERQHAARPLFYNDRLEQRTVACQCFTLHHDPLLLEHFNQSGSFAAGFGLDFLSDTRQLNLLCPGLPLVAGTHLQMLGHGRHILEAPRVHRREQGAELPYLKSQRQARERDNIQAWFKFPLRMRRHLLLFKTLFYSFSWI